MDRLKQLFAIKAVRTVVLIVLALLAAVSVYAGIRNALEFSQDFQWDAAKALCMRLDPYELSLDPQKCETVPELAEFYRMFTDRGLTQKMEANQFPSLLLLLVPMTVFSPKAAIVVWLILNLLFTACIVILLRRTFFKDISLYGYAVGVLIMLAGTPYRNQLGVGQHTLFSFCFFMLAVYLDSHMRDGSIGKTAAVSFCLFVSYFKYTLTAPLALYFLYRKRYKELALSVAGHIVLTEAAALWLGRSFIYMIKAPLSVASALVTEGGIDLGVFLPGALAYIAAAVIGIGLVVISLMLPEGNEDVLFSLLILWSLVLTYHRTYDFFVLSAVYMMFMSKREEAAPALWTGAKLYYWLLLVAVYFVLRIFNENEPSKMAVAVAYYVFAVCTGIFTVRLIKEKKNGC